MLKMNGEGPKEETFVESLRKQENTDPTDFCWPDQVQKFNIYQLCSTYTRKLNLSAPGFFGSLACIHGIVLWHSFYISKFTTRHKKMALNA